ncbi:MAG: archaetidylserine decarboxylase [Gammaproteobacteria bacterium]|nr:archaetidylserine decarboxylase [Gammaproteobacteria bacterium]
MFQRIFGSLSTLILHVVPHRPLARIAWRITRVRLTPVKNILIRFFAFLYRVDMNEAAEPDPRQYPHFNAFFVRALRPGARPISDDSDDIISPADSVVSACGEVRDGNMIQAKGIAYTAAALLGDSACAAEFAGGNYATLYLSPRDYHRVHVPVDGHLRQMRYLPGELFSVNDYSTRHVHGLFARNERLVTVFDTPAGPMALVMVGAMFVAAMETTWSGPVDREHPFGHWQPDGEPVRLARGEELGRFNMGSTVILLFPAGRTEWTSRLTEGARVQMGETIGRVV